MIVRNEDLIDEVKSQFPKFKIETLKGHRDVFIINNERMKRVVYIQIHDPIQNENELFLKCKNFVDFVITYDSRGNYYIASTFDDCKYKVNDMSIITNALSYNPITSNERLGLTASNKPSRYMQNFDYIFATNTLLDRLLNRYGLESVLIKGRSLFELRRVGSKNSVKVLIKTGSKISHHTHVIGSVFDGADIIVAISDHNEYVFFDSSEIYPLKKSRAVSYSENNVKTNDWNYFSELLDKRGIETKKNTAVVEMVHMTNGPLLERAKERAVEVDTEHEAYYKDFRLVMDEDGTINIINSNDIIAIIDQSVINNRDFVNLIQSISVA